MARYADLINPITIKGITKTETELAGEGLIEFINQNYKNQKLESLESIYKGIIPGGDQDKTATHNIKRGLSTLVLYSVATKVGGPVGFAVAAGISLILHASPQENGYSAMSNWGDHGLNDWKFKMENNFENMVAIAASFSENFIHGISWRVEDSWWDSPDSWIRPGQSGNEPWMKLSTDYLSTPRGNVKTKKKFVYGRKIEEQGFESITQARKRFLAQKMGGKRIFEELGTVFSNGSIEGDYSKFKINTYGGVEYSGGDRHYDITWYHLKSGYWEIKRYVPNIDDDDDDYLTAFEPNMSVHENDNDNKEKKWNFHSSIPDGLEIKYDSVGTVVVRFENEGKRIFTTSKAWTNLHMQKLKNGQKMLLEGKTQSKMAKEWT